MGCKEATPRSSRKNQAKSTKIVYGIFSKIQESIDSLPRMRDACAFGNTFGNIRKRNGKRLYQSVLPRENYRNDSIETKEKEATAK